MNRAASTGGAARLRVFAALFALVLATAPDARATLPAAGWLPASQGLVPMAGADNAWAPPYIYPVTHLRPDPSVPGRIFAGHLFHGLYVYEAGVWTTLTPGCSLPPGNGERQAFLDASGLTACGVIDIAVDPTDPKIVYVSAVVPRGTLASPQLDPGGVFRSTDGGLRWTRISPPFRAGGLAIARAAGGKTTIVAGSIQRTAHEVGTTTSLIVSTNDGASWRGVALPPPTGCAPHVAAVSSRLVATVGFHPTNANVVYAGSNAGLYVSTNRGSTWALALKACGKVSGVNVGGAWGVAFARQGATTYVYSATWDGVVRRAVAGTKAWSGVAKLNGTFVRDLIVDVRNPSRLYAAAIASKGAAVYRITASGAVAIENNALAVDDPTLSRVVSAVSGLPKVYNLSKDRATPSITQHPLAPDLLFAATVLGGVFVRSEPA